jgi:transcriptional regulator with XRE-family HTH domain
MKKILRTSQQDLSLWNIGKRIRQRRILMGMTQADLGAAVGIRFQQIQKYEVGANRVNVERLPAMAQALQCSIEYFFPHEGDAADDYLLRESFLPLARLYIKMSRSNRDQCMAVARALVAIQESKELPNASPR